MTGATEHPEFDAFEAAERLAPIPATRDAATVDAWKRHYAALAFAAYADFYRLIRSDPQLRSGENCRPDWAYLPALAVSATAAAVALDEPADSVGHLLWDLTPEVGALNGEWEEWLVAKLDRLGVNPADINPQYNGDDFRSPRAAEKATR